MSNSGDVLFELFRHWFAVGWALDAVKDSRNGIHSVSAIPYAEGVVFQSPGSAPPRKRQAPPWVIVEQNRLRRRRYTGRLTVALFLWNAFGAIDQSCVIRSYPPAALPNLEHSGSEIEHQIPCRQSDTDVCIVPDFHQVCFAALRQIVSTSPKAAAC